MKSPITTHILDTSLGVPAKGVQVTLEYATNDQWKPMADTITNDDGRIMDWLPYGHDLQPGVYRICFKVLNYFKAQGKKCFYPFIEITFHVDDPAKHYHVPLLLSAHGYSTYRGS